MRIPSKIVEPSILATEWLASAAYYTRSKGMNGTMLDSVVAVVFLITLSVGLWQWLHTPVADPHPGGIEVQLSNMLLRGAATPMPSSPSSASVDNDQKVSKGEALVR